MNERTEWWARRKYPDWSMEEKMMENTEKCVRDMGGKKWKNYKLQVLVAWECEERKRSQSSIDETMGENFPPWKTSNHRFKEYYESKQDKYKKPSLTQRQVILKALRGKSDTLTSTEQHDWHLTSIKTDEENGIYISEGLKDNNWKQRILGPMKIHCKMIMTCPRQLKWKMTVGEDVGQTAQAFCWWEWEEQATTLETAAFNDVNMPLKPLQ